MNKNEFINILSKKTKLSLKDTELVNNILENNFFISKKNKDKIISEIVIKLNISIEEATTIYNIAKDIINSELRNKLKHPLG